jgi:hypothetical protein
MGGSVITLLAGLHSVKKICALVPLERFPRSARPVMAWLGAKPGANPKE